MYHFILGFELLCCKKIKTGHGVPALPQDDLVYLCCSFTALVGSGIQWCFTDGNAATRITEFFTNEDDYKMLDWKSIYSTEWNDNNSDGDHDRMRKKHAEFLVKDHVPVKYIRCIVVKTPQRHELIQQWVDDMALDIKIYSDKPQFYF